MSDSEDNFINNMDYDLVHEIIEDEIQRYIVNHLAIMNTGTPDRCDTYTWEKAINEARHLHLAEPWLPACNAVKRLKAAGLLAEADANA